MSLFEPEQSFISGESCLCRCMCVLTTLGDLLYSRANRQKKLSESKSYSDNEYLGKLVTPCRNLP